MHLITIGKGASLDADIVRYLVVPGGSATTALVKAAKEQGKIYDATHGKATVTYLALTDGYVAFSTASLETLKKRIYAAIHDAPPEES